MRTCGARRPRYRAATASAARDTPSGRSSTVDRESSRGSPTSRCSLSRDTPRPGCRWAPPRRPSAHLAVDRIAETQLDTGTQHVLDRGPYLHPPRGRDRQMNPVRTGPAPRSTAAVAPGPRNRCGSNSNRRPPAPHRRTGRPKAVLPQYRPQAGRPVRPSCDGSPASTRHRLRGTASRGGGATRTPRPRCAGPGRRPSGPPPSRHAGARQDLPSVPPPKSKQ